MTKHICEVESWVPGMPYTHVSGELAVQDAHKPSCRAERGGGQEGLRRGSGGAGEKSSVRDLVSRDKVREC